MSLHHQPLLAEPTVVLVSGEHIPIGVFDWVVTLLGRGHDVRVVDGEVLIVPAVSDDLTEALNRRAIDVAAVLRCAGALRD